MTNSRRSRREFLEMLGAGAASASSLLAASTLGAVAPQAQQVTAPRTPDLVVFNAKVYTVDPRLPHAEAFAVKAGRFVGVGTTADIRGLVAKGTETYDARQMTIVPGFVDCHNHAPGDVLLYEVLVGNPYEVEFVTISSIIDKLRSKAAKTPPGMWVEGFFSTTPKSKRSASSTSTISIKSRPNSPSPSIIAAAIQPITTARHSNSRTSPKPLPTHLAVHLTAIPAARSTAASPIAPAPCSIPWASDPRSRKPSGSSATAMPSPLFQSNSSAMASRACITKPAISPRSSRCARAANSCIVSATKPPARSSTP